LAWYMVQCAIHSGHGTWYIVRCIRWAHYKVQYRFTGPPLSSRARSQGQLSAAYDGLTDIVGCVMPATWGWLYAKFAAVRLTATSRTLADTTLPVVFFVFTKMCPELIWMVLQLALRCYRYCCSTETLLCAHTLRNAHGLPSATSCVRRHQPTSQPRSSGGWARAATG
jgi:hypothetical protein